MKTYKIILEILTPLYIGNGTTLSKKDYVLRAGNVYVYEPIKLHGLLGVLYENFLMDNKTLTDLLNNNRMVKNLDLKSALKHTVKSGDNSIKKSDTINEFIKDAYGQPYIPGSSLKGAIRTALLAQEIRKNHSKFSQFRSEALNRWSKSNQVEETAFGKIIDNKFKNLRISDSRPTSPDNLILSKKIDVFKDNNSNNKLNLCRESLGPGTKIEFDMSVLSDKEGVFTPENIMNAINEFTKEYKKRFLSKFNSFDEKHYGKNIIYLGGGTGFLTKTINYSLYGDKALEITANLLTNNFKRHNHRKDIALGISPRAKKCTKINNETMEIGICRMEIV